MATSCARALAAIEALAFVVPAAKDQPPFPEKEFDFEERPSQDFFCPVSLELLLEPQQTSCCGNHLSLEVATRLRREGKACPMCTGEQWSAMPDKYHRRKVHEIRVRCWNKDSGCGWVGEVSELKRHAVSCDKRPWECQYCGLKCIVGEGEGNHWPDCHKFPEPCPNGCEVGSVERWRMEQHRSVCPLEPVACEMKEFGCSVVVPRRELATHMRESELQHLTAMTALNLRLTRQLQQESTERDRKMERLQVEVTELRELGKVQKEALSEVKCICKHIEQHTGVCTGYKVLTFHNYNEMKIKACQVRGLTSLNVIRHMTKGKNSSVQFSCFPGYEFQLIVKYYHTSHNDIGVFLNLMEGNYDHKFQWPVKVKVHLELLNQAGDHNHVMRIETLEWKKEQTDITKKIDSSLMKYSDLERNKDGVQYMMNDCLKFRVHVSVMSQ